MMAKSGVDAVFIWPSFQSMQIGSLLLNGIISSRPRNIGAELRSTFESTDLGTVIRQYFAPPWFDPATRLYL